RPGGRGGSPPQVTYGLPPTANEPGIAVDPRLVAFTALPAGLAGAELGRLSALLLGLPNLLQMLTSFCDVSRERRAVILAHHTLRDAFFRRALPLALLTKPASFGLRNTDLASTSVQLLALSIGEQEVL